MALNIKPKRQRKPDWTKEETDVLIQLFIQHNDELTGKFSSQLTNADKAKIYKSIMENVNAIGGNDRTVESVKNKWQLLKADVKNKAAKILAKQRKTVRITGGGEAPEDARLEEVLTEAEMGIYSIIPSEAIEGILVDYSIKWVFK